MSLQEVFLAILLAKMTYAGPTWHGMCSAVEVCTGMGKTGIPWDSHGNGSKISHGMGIKCMGMGVKTWELE